MLKVIISGILKNVNYQTVEKIFIYMPSCHLGLEPFNLTPSGFPLKNCGNDVMCILDLGPWILYPPR